MKNNKLTIMLVAATLLLFQFTVGSSVLNAQSADGIKTGIGGGDVSELPPNQDTNVGYYVLAGALVVGVGLYFYIKWHKNKFRKHSIKKAESKKEDLFSAIENVKSHIPFDFSIGYKKGNDLGGGSYYLGFHYGF